ncbi:MAG: GNAT family N-acetyltransferase [Pseudomonadota bacterium]
MRPANVADVMIDPGTEVLTPRCRLRYPSEADIPHIFSASREPGFNDGMVWDPPAHIDDLREPLRSHQAAWEEGSAYTWTIEQRLSNVFVGRISIRREPGGEAREWSIGFWVHPTRQRQGYATEVAQAVVAFGFERLQAACITAAHATWNDASGEVLQRLGMRRVRTNPRGFQKGGRWVEEYEYELRRPA